MPLLWLEPLAYLLAALLAGWLWGWPGAALALALALAATLGRHAWRSHQLMRWLHEPDPATVPRLRGVWGDAAYSSARALRAQQRKAQDSAQRLRDFRQALQASPNGVVLLDPQGRIEWCNAMAGLHLGLDPQRDILQHIINLVREPAFSAYYHRCQSGDVTPTSDNDPAQGSSHEGGVTLTGRQGTSAQPMRLHVQLHPHGQGHWLMLSRDITALLQAEAMRRDFVANVSHEIRTPLTVLAGFVESLQNLPLSEAERQHCLQLMQTQASRMQTLVKDLLALSRLEGSPLPGVREAVPLAGLMTHCLAEAQALSALLHPAPAAPQQLHFAPAPSLSLLGDEAELRSAISNLINNAVRYTPAGGHIHVDWASLPHGGLRLSVRDTGCGIAPEHLPRLGERFYRVDRSRSRESGGTGLGLAIAKHVVQRHGGEMHITSTPGQGSTFSLQWPASRVKATSA